MPPCEGSTVRSVRCRRESQGYQKARPYLGGSPHRRGRNLCRREVPAVDRLLRREVAAQRAAKGRIVVIVELPVIRASRKPVLLPVIMLMYSDSAFSEEGAPYGCFVEPYSLVGVASASSDEVVGEMLT
jgi:hypothetical protein